jgi:hypothetical protein
VANTPLLVDRRYLPRDIGLAEAGRMPDSIAAEMKRQGTVQGECEPPLAGAPGNPRCDARYPGYVLRFSPVFILKNDSVQVYMYAQQYETAGSGHSQTLRFERAYQVVRRGDGWTAAREGHVPKELRGER